MILDKRDLMNRKFILLNDPDNVYENLNPAFDIDLENTNVEDLRRYVTKLYYDQDIPVDYNKVIKISLAEYLKKHITDKNLKDIEKMRKEEASIIKEAKRKEKPKYDWDKG